jgi:hypothetical protein
MAEFGKDPYDLGLQVPNRLPGTWTLNPTVTAINCYLVGHTLSVPSGTALTAGMTVTAAGFAPGTIIAQQLSATSFFVRPASNAIPGAPSASIGPVSISAGVNLLPLIPTLPPGTEAWCSDIQGVATWNGSTWVSTSKNLLSKIRAAIAAAANGDNAVELQPWLPPANMNTAGNLVRANSTAYPGGLVFTNAAGTHQFVVFTAGTTAAAEPATITSPLVTTDPYNMGNITDGTAVVQWMGPVRTTTALAGAPSIVAGAQPSSLTQSTFVSGQNARGAAPNSAFRLTGGTGAFVLATSNNFAAVRGSSYPSSGSNYFSGFYNSAGNATACEFMTDAPYLAFDMEYTGGLALAFWLTIEVDGRRLFDGTCAAITAISSPNGFLILDFRNTGIRKARRIRLGTVQTIFNTTGSNCYFGRVLTTPADTIWYPQNPNRYRICMFGDSLIGFANASSPLLPLFDWPSQFAALVGCDDISALGVGGTGFLNSAGYFTYIQRVGDIVAAAPDVVIINGAFNDSNANGYTSAQRQASMLLFLQALRAALPKVMIIMSGTFGGINVAGNVLIENDQIAAVTAFGDSNTFFMPVSTDTPQWFTGTGALGAPSGTGNNDVYIGPTDTTHPSQLALGYVAQKMSTAFKALIGTMSVNP